MKIADWFCCIFGSILIWGAAINNNFICPMHKTFGDNFKIPLNTGGAKDAFSFPKGQRFSPTPEFECKTSYYNNNEQRANRTASFGFG